MRLVLIRHAHSQHSQHGLIADLRGCTGLTDVGVQQAHVLANRLHISAEWQECAVVLASPVRRACQTAGILAHSLSRQPLREDADLRELLPGAADGMSWADYQARYGLFDPVAEPDRPFAPGGETWNGFLTRVQTTLHRLAAQYHGQTIVVVSHAGFIVASLLVLFAIPRPGTDARFEPRHTSITVWERAADSWCLERYNDTWHLDQEQLLKRAG
ncbi:MAG TPA: histidine phosphatase family protein [Herpetosiphonaceae bacterium]